MNPLHLVWMLPLAALFGYCMGFIIGNNEEGGDSDGLDNSGDFDR